MVQLVWSDINIHMKIHAEIPHKVDEIKNEPAHKSPQVSFLLSDFLSLPNGI
jgi:hypothetical protein